MDVKRIINLIRGLSPNPGAYAILDGKMLKIFCATGEEAPAGETAGKLRLPTERGLPVTAADGYVYLREVQLENKKSMSIHDFLRGYRIAPETILA
jgi:methionyl-tRNA formyltransferase